MKKQELSAKELSKVCGGAYAAATGKKLFDAGSVEAPAPESLDPKVTKVQQI